MPNYNKSFNFRNGVQVDEDNFFVNSTGNIGIGTTIPRSTLDLRGDLTVSGFTTSATSYSGIGSFGTLFLGSDIQLDSESGIITAASFYGDGSTLDNLPGSKWISVDPQNASDAIYSTAAGDGVVGVATTNPSPTKRYAFQVGEEPEDADPNIILSGGVGITSNGYINATGIITATEGFSGPGGQITGINASNVASGTLNTAVLPTQINIVGVATISDVVVGNGATVAGVSTFTDQGLTAKNVTAAAFTGGTIYSDSVVTIDQTTGYINFTNGGGIRVSDQVGAGGSFLVADSTGGLVWASDLTLGGIATVGFLTARQIFSRGITTTSTLDVTTSADIATLNVGKIVSNIPAQTNEITRITSGIITTTDFNATTSDIGVGEGTSLDLERLDVSGIGTVANLHAGNIRINVETDKITSESTSLQIGGEDDTVTVGNDLVVSGTSKFTGIATFGAGIAANTNNTGSIGAEGKSFGEAFIGSIGIATDNDTKIDTLTGDLNLDADSGKVNVKVSLEVDKSLIVEETSRFTGISSYEADLIPFSNQGASLGSSTNKFGAAHIDNITIGETDAQEIKTSTGDLKLSTANAGKVSISTNTTIDYQLTTKNLTVSAASSIGGDIVPIEGTDPAPNLGASGRIFGSAYIGNTKIGASDQNTIDTSSGALNLDANSNLVHVKSNLEVDNHLQVDQGATLSGISTIVTGLKADSDKGAYIGASDKAFSAAYINELTIGVSGNTGLVSTRTGDLTLDSFSGTTDIKGDVTVAGELTVSGLSTSSVNGDLEVNGDVFPKLNTDVSIGKTTKRYAAAYIDDIQIGHSGQGTIDTRTGNLTLDAQGGTVDLNANLDVQDRLIVGGSADISGITTFRSKILPNTDASSDTTLGASDKAIGKAYVGDVQIADNTANVINTRSGNLVLDSTGGTVNIQDQLDVDEHATFDKGITVTGVSTYTGNLLASTDEGANIGSPTKRFNEGYFSNLTLGVDGEHILGSTVVNLGIGTVGNMVSVGGTLTVTGKLTANVESNLGGKTEFGTGLVPTSDVGSYIGTTGKRFSEAHIGNIKIAQTDDQTISTKSGELKLTSTGVAATTRVLNNLTVDKTLTVTELSKFSGIGSFVDGLIPTASKGAYLGLTGFEWSEAHVDDITLGVDSPTTINTIQSDLVLDANTNLVVVNAKLSVGSGLTVSGDIDAGPLYVDDTNNRIGVGTTAPTVDLEVFADGNDSTLRINSLDDSSSPILSLKSGSKEAVLKMNDDGNSELLISNTTTGPIIINLEDNTINGINTGNFVLRHKTDDLLTVTYEGSVGIGSDIPKETFDVVGTSTVSGNSFVGGNLEVDGDISFNGTLNYTVPDGENLSLGIVTTGRLRVGSSGTFTAESAAYFEDDIFLHENASIRSRVTGAAVSISQLRVLNDSEFTGVSTFSAEINVFNNSSIILYNDATVAAATTFVSIEPNRIGVEELVATEVDSTLVTADSIQVGITTISEYVDLNGDLEVSGIVTTTGTRVSLGGTIYGPDGELFIGGSNTVQPFVGIGTTTKINAVNLYNDKLSLLGNLIVGVGTTAVDANSETYSAPLGSPVDVLGGGFSILDKNIYTQNSNIFLDIGTKIEFRNNTNHNVRSILDRYGHVMLGIGTNNPAGAVDFRFAGHGVNDSAVGAYANEVRYMLPPQVDDDTARAGLSTVAGAMIFNVGAGKHQAYDGSTWHDLY
jgi:hypothetical protein